MEASSRSPLAPGGLSSINNTQAAFLKKTPITAENSGLTAVDQRREQRRISEVSAAERVASAATGLWEAGTSRAAPETPSAPVARPAIQRSSSAPEDPQTPVRPVFQKKWPITAENSGLTAADQRAEQRRISELSAAERVASAAGMGLREAGTSRAAPETPSAPVARPAIQRSSSAPEGPQTPFRPVLLKKWPITAENSGLTAADQRREQRRISEVSAAERVASAAGRVQWLLSNRTLPKSSTKPHGSPLECHPPRPGGNASDDSAGFRNRRTRGIQGLRAKAQQSKQGGSGQRTRSGSGRLAKRIRSGSRMDQARKRHPRGRSGSRCPAPPCRATRSSMCRPCASLTLVQPPTPGR
jgi:hypothetical protein